MISVSIVSHGHAALVASLLSDLAGCTENGIDAIVTVNVPETPELEPGSFPFPVALIRNDAPRGFAANHNAAFRRSRGEYFCVLNPDIRIRHDPFPRLVDALRDLRVAVSAPLVLGPDGQVEDSARRFPTPGILFRKLIGAHATLEYSFDAPVVFPDWVAGMFMLFKRESFAALEGFDERYHLYYEDVDLCSRARDSGMEIALVTGASVVHDARRASRRNLWHMLWHARSALRYLTGV
jgi:N-acetylglucosaminyl-diphospho-decaprenol L-rhamnosyltransferase